MKLRTFFSVLLTGVMLCFSVPALAQAGADFSGSWYNPSRDGEGFHIQYLDTGQALVIWFTFPGASDNPETEQAWILGIGDVNGPTITINDAFKASGPQFGEAYDTSEFNRVIWGDLQVVFTGPDAGTVSYDGLDGSGATQIVRITSIADSDGDSSLPPGVSGAWFDPETDGQGWFIEILSASAALVYWFTYDGAGNQAWNLGVGEIFKDKIVLSRSLAGKGTRFGSGFQAGDVDRQPFSMITMEFENCSAGKMTYFLADGAENGSFPIQRLTTLKNHGCEAVSTPTVRQLVMSNLQDPQVNQYTGLDGIQVSLFGKKASGGRLDKLRSGVIKTATGNTVLFTLDPAGSLVQIQDEESGITLSTGVGEDGEPQTVLNDPQNGVSSSVGTSSGGVSGVQKSSAGQTKAPDPAGALSRAQADGSGIARVLVDLCGAPATEALVNFIVDDGSGTGIVLSAAQDAAGEYWTEVPTGLAPPLADDVLDQSCSTAALQFESVCGAVAALGDGQGAAFSPEVCAELGLQISEANPAAALDATAVCTETVFAFASVCAANEQRAGSCGAESESLYRDFSGVQIRAEASVPGLFGSASTPGQVYDNPEQTLTLPSLVIPGRPYYLNHAVLPAEPKAGDDYNVTVNLGCVDPGQVLSVRNTSTGESASCTVGGSGDCAVNLGSDTSDDDHVLEITGANGLFHQLVVGLDTSETGGPDDGFWRVEFPDDDEIIRLAVAIKHPNAFICDFSLLFGDFETYDFAWDPAREYYVASIEGDQVGMKVEGGDNFCLAVFNPFDTECRSAVEKSSWDDATAGDSGLCPRPGFLD